MTTTVSENGDDKEEEVGSHVYPLIWVYQHRGLANGCQSILMTSNIPSPHIVQRLGS